MALPELSMAFAAAPKRKLSRTVSAAIELFAGQLLDQRIYIYGPSGADSCKDVLAQLSKAKDLPTDSILKFKYKN